MKIWKLKKTVNSYKSNIENLKTERDNFFELLKKGEISMIERYEVIKNSGYEISNAPIRRLLGEFFLGQRYINKIYNNKIKKYEADIEEMEQKIKRNEIELSNLVDMTIGEYSRLKSKMEERINSEVEKSSCGCSRHSAREFLYELSDSEAMLAYSSSIRDHLFSYCKVTKSSNSSNNIDTLLDLLWTSEDVVSKIKKKSSVTQELFDTIETLANDVRCLTYKRYQEPVYKSFQRFAKLLEDASSEGRYYHAYRIAAIMYGLAFTDEMNNISKELMKKYSVGATREILSDKSMDMESKMIYLGKIYQLSDKVKSEMDRFEEMMRKTDQCKDIERKIKYIKKDMEYSKDELVTERKYAIQRATESLSKSMNELEKSKENYNSINGKGVLDEIKRQEIQKLDKKIEETQKLINEAKAPFEQKYTPWIEKIDEIQRFFDSAIKKLYDRKMTKQEYNRLKHELRLYKRSC